MNSLSEGTLALWPWRSGATYAARSILVHAEDIWQTARKAYIELEGAQGAKRHLKLAHEALCLVELRLKDLLPTRADQIRAQSEALPAHQPTLLETTAVFMPSETPSGLAYLANPDHILRRVRRHTKLDANSGYVADVGNPLVTPFALMGLTPAGHGELEGCLNCRRFDTHGLDAVIVDLTRTARRALKPDWQHQLVELLTALDGMNLLRATPIVILCEDAFALRSADLAVRRYAEQSSSGNRRLLKRGALLLEAGLLEAPGTPEVSELLPISFAADVKDASLAPLRDRLIGLSRRLRETGHVEGAIGILRGLHALSTFASLPLGIKEAKENSSVLFDGDGREEVAVRSSFFPTAALQPMAEVATAAPELAADIRELLDEVRSRVCLWEQDTPVSLKLAQLLRDSEWNSPDILLVLPDTHTAAVFQVSNRGLSCTCTVVEASRLAEQATIKEWRRLIIVRPERRVLRALLTMRITPSRVLLLGDAAGISLIAAEVKLLASIPEFSPFAGRASAMAAALDSGGVAETLELDGLEYGYHTATTEALIDLTQMASAYTGEVVHLTLEGGGRVAYRPGSDVLVFTPDEVRPFRKVAASAVSTGDSILVLRNDIRDKLSEALSRSRKTLAQLRLYHERVVKFRQSLSGNNLPTKARHALTAMQEIDPTISDREVPNIVRWLSVEPSDSAQQPRAARDLRRFLVFMEAAGVNKTLAGSFWDFAVVPVRTYSAMEGHHFNRHIVHFVMDPEGIAAGAGWREFDGLWQAVVDSVDSVIHKEVSDG